MKNDCKASHDCKGMKKKEHEAKEKMLDKRKGIMREGKEKMPTAHKKGHKK